MVRRGVHHLGLASPDYEGTVRFYHEVLGLDIAWQDLLLGPDGTEQVRHVFFDFGNETYIAFMCSAPGSKLLPESWAADINSGLGVMHGAYHFAFCLDSLEELQAKYEELLSRGVEPTEIIDHGWCKSVYFRDPVNGLMLEYCVSTRVFTEDDKELKARLQPGFKPFKDAEAIARTAKVFKISEEDLLQRFGHAKGELVPS